MNKVLLLWFLVLGSTLGVFSQKSNVVKRRTTEFSLKVKTSSGWSEWDEWERSKLLVVFNIDKRRISIFSKQNQVYDIIEWKEDSIKGSDEIMSWVCINEDGKRCLVEFWKRFDEDGYSYNQLYVHFSDFSIVFNLE